MIKYLKEQVETYKFKTPKDLLNHMKNFRYGWMDKNYKFYDSYSTKTKPDLWWKTYRLSLPKDVEKYKCGICYDQTVYENYMFDKYFPELEHKMIHIQYYKVNNHAFLIYKENNKWFHFENSWAKYTGIHGPYTDIDTIIDIIHKNGAEEDKVDHGYEWHYMNPKDFTTRLTGPEFYKKVKYNWKYSE